MGAKPRWKIPGGHMRGDQQCLNLDPYLLLRRHALAEHTLLSWITLPYRGSFIVDRG